MLRWNRLCAIKIGLNGVILAIYARNVNSANASADQSKRQTALRQVVREQPTLLLITAKPVSLVLSKVAAGKHTLCQFPLRTSDSTEEAFTVAKQLVGPTSDLACKL